MTEALYESYDPATQRATEVTTDSETGLPVIVKSQNTRPIIEAAKRQAASFDATVRRDVTHVARIPAVIWQNLMRLGIAKDEKALNAWLNERDNRVFRVDDARRL